MIDKNEPKEAPIEGRDNSQVVSNDAQSSYQVREVTESSSQVKITQSSSTVNVSQSPTQVNNSNQTSSEVCPAMDKLAQEAVEFCKDKDIYNPTEILRVMQNKFVLGRNLEVQSVSDVSEGMTQYILVDRENLLHTAFEELKVVPIEDLRKTLQVDFYGEVKYINNGFIAMLLN